MNRVFQRVREFNRFDKAYIYYLNEMGESYSSISQQLAVDSSIISEICTSYVPVMDSQNGYHFEAYKKAHKTRKSLKKQLLSEMNYKYCHNELCSEPPKFFHFQYEHDIVFEVLPKQFRSPMNRNQICSIARFNKKMKHVFNSKKLTDNCHSQISSVFLSEDQSLQNDIEKLKNSYCEVSSEKQLFLLDLYKKGMKKPSNGKRYKNHQTKLFWTELFLLSRKSFSYVSKMLNGPVISTVSTWLTEHRENYPQIVKDKKDIVSNNIKWKKLYNLSNNNLIDVGLAVDAIKITETVKIKENSEFSGLLNSDDISIDEINNLLKCFKSFEKFVQKQYDNKNIISNIFVFYIIPLNNIFAKHLPIYYIEHSQGNADDKVIRDIYEMIELLRHPTLKLNLHFLALDGDLKYKGFHDTFIHDWMSNFNQAKNLFNSSHMLFHVICDPNHVLKRLRYRFVNHVKLAWTSKSKQYGTFDIRNFFDVPEKVLSNKSSTKMDDFFPKELFKKKNLATLYDYEIWDLFSFFMICASLNIAVHENTPRYTVLMMLSISAEFLLIYRRFLNGKKSEHIPYFKNNSIISINGTTYPNYEKSAKTQNTKQSNETKQPRTIDIKNQIIATTFLDKPLIDHLLNDIVSLISALGTVESSFSMIEYGTMLLEHYFGRVRLGCRYNYEIEKIIEVIDRLIIIDHMNLNNPDLTNIVNSRNYEFACVEEGSNQLVKEDVLKCRQIALQLWKNIDSSVLLHDEEILLESFSFDFKSLIDDIYDLDSLIEKHKLSPPRQSRSTNETRLLKQNNQTIVRRYSNSGYGKMKK